MDWKKFGRKLIFPPGWVLLVLTVISAAGLAAVFVKGWDASPVAYAVYVLAFYTLCVVCVFFALVLPKRYRQIRQKVYDNKFGNRYMTDAAFRTHVSLYLSLGMNLVYALTNVFFCVTNHSAWFAILAAYYAILAVMRFLLVRFVRRVGIGKDLLREMCRARLCAVILLLVNLTLSGAVLMMLYQNRGYAYSAVMIYVMALYTFYTTGHAVVDIVKYQKYNSPVMSTAKVITLASALVSMLNLETAMFDQFGGEMPAESQRIMIMLTGAGVSAAVVTMSGYMIYRSIKEIKTVRSKENE